MRLFLPLLCLLLCACVNSSKLLEQGQYARALEICSQQLRKGRIKARELADLEHSFYLLTRQDSLRIAELRATRQPEIWPEIYQLALSIQARQADIKDLQSELAESGYFPSLDLYPAGALLAEAATNSALYHYANAQEYIPAARNHDQKAARAAYSQLGKSLEYVADFKNADALRSEMKDLGTLHLWLKDIDYPNGYYFDRDLIEVLYWGKAFPLEENWLMVYLDPAQAPRMDMVLEIYFDNIVVSADNQAISTCTSSTEVENGFVLKKVWSPKDSAYIEVKEIVYQTVSAHVTSVTQSKEAQLALQMDLYEADSRKHRQEKRFFGSSSWSNTHITYSGDERALSSSCPVPGGIWMSFPDDSRLLEEAIDDLKWTFWAKVIAVQDL